MSIGGELRWTAALAVGAAVAMPGALQAAPPKALFTDPPTDVTNPARMVPLRIPSGDAAPHALAYLAAGAGPHPTLVLLHGLPGHEKNGDLAQAVRRAGWNVVVMGYRGAWGNEGRFSFANCIEDARAAVRYLREPANAQALRIDSRRLVLGGHSMGGWAAALAAASGEPLAGVIVVSSSNLGSFGQMPRARLVALMADSRDTIAASPEAMADELTRDAASFDWMRAAPQLARSPLLVLNNVENASAASARLSAAVELAGGHVTRVHVPTDHNWNTARVRLAEEVIGWLTRLPAR